MQRVVVVGGSLAGLRGAEALRAGGFDGSLTIVGDEAHAPYDRPPLSKQVLAGEWEPERTQLAQAPGFEAEWIRGTAASGLDLERRVVSLADGRELPFDGLLIACGARARTLPGLAGTPGAHVVRTLDDAVALRAELDAGPRRVVVVGAGFIGAEVAATCRERGLEGTIVEPLPAPLARVLGEEMGQVMAGLHRDHGVDLRLGVGVERVEGDGRVERVVLGDGEVLEADVVVVGIGVIPNTEWLADSGLQIEDGIVVDETTLAAPGVVAAGDVARWPNPTFGGELMRVEHWEHAINMGVHAARRLLVELDRAAGRETVTPEPFATVPWFWSDQYDRKVQLAGRPRATDDLAIVAGSVADRRFCALYGRDGRVTAVLAVNMPAKVVRYRRQLEAGLGWDEALAAAAEAQG